ncbi:glutaredoxin family protein [Bacillus sp. FJAT-45037]|uniref:glutaredoxin family protein n=1 Tax=Bacillus sp. FJAT-45037 TaxID=2011007 RepID=UPI000C24C4A9|nr:glutaredoxin family protein [Bacillus sp. FJAT-45037]
MLEVKVYSKDHCPLCDKGVAVLKELQQEIPFEFTVIDIYQDDDLLEQYQLMIPVVSINGEDIDFGQFSKGKIRNRLHQFNQ